MSRKEPLISEESAVCLARVFNRIASSFDVAELSAEEVVEIHLLLERFTDTLVHEHADMLESLYQSVTELGGFSDDDESGGEGH